MGANGKEKPNGYSNKMIEEETPTTPDPVKDPTKEPASDEPENTSSIISRLAAYKSISEGANEIASGIEKKCSEKNIQLDVLIVDGPAVSSSDLSLLQLKASFTHFNNSFEDILKRIRKPKGLTTKASADSIVGDIITAILGLVPELIKALKRDYGISNDDFTIEAEALKIAVASNLTSKNKVIQSVRILDFNLISKSEIIQQLTDLLRRKAEIDGECEKLRKVSSKGKEENSDILKEWEILAGAFNKFFEAITANGEKRSILLDAALREHVNETKVTHLLYLSILTGGGHVLAVEQLREKGDFDFFGGSAVSYVLADKTTGAILTSSMVTQLSKIRYQKNGDLFDYRLLELKRRVSNGKTKPQASGGKGKPRVSTLKPRR